LRREGFTGALTLIGDEPCEPPTTARPCPSRSSTAGCRAGGPPCPGRTTSTRLGLGRLGLGRLVL